MADATAISSNTSHHFQNGQFIVIIVDVVSCLLAISWKKILVNIRKIINKYNVVIMINLKYDDKKFNGSREARLVTYVQISR